MKVRSKTNRAVHALGCREGLADTFHGVVGLVEVEVDQAFFLGFDLGGEVPGHAVDERGRFGVLANLWQLFEEVAVAEGDAVHTGKRCPVSGRVADATALFEVE